MFSKEESRKQLENLVKTFRDNYDQYKLVEYKEHRVRTEFIDKFLIYLGWDVRNEQGLSEKYKEVIGEDAIKIEGKTKAPDYALRVGGSRIFFVEAKKPAVNIKTDSEPAFQLKRYAWNSKIPISILTDFEELSVYDCRIKPDPKAKPETGRILYLNFEEYVENFDRIWDNFSKDAVLKGNFDRFVESSKDKKGTGEVDKAFLKEIETWREDLAKNIALRNSTLSVSELNFSIQKTIDRILFLRICEDRNIEIYETLKNIATKNHIYSKLLDLFDEADAKYNSGLFDFTSDSITKTLAIDDAILKQIILNLYYPISPYDFSILNIEILGRVYEKFLGKIIRLTPSHIAKIEDKPEVKIAGGIYYTPEFIVEYIVKNTVGKYIKGKTPKETEKIRILDSACGSGTFLVGAYSYLLDYHLDYYSKNPKKFKKEIYLYKENQWFLTTEIRKKILLNNIFGLDIDPQAVEISKLSLLLKVLENETGETVNQQLKLFQERALPDLGNNIKSGNSLVDSSFFRQEKSEQVSSEKLSKINPFDWSDKEKGFGQIIDEGGFDIIIGNPPYVKEDKNREIFEDVKKTNMKKYYQGKMDYWYFFSCHALDLLKDGGYHSFIAQNNWGTSTGAKTLRKKILNDSKLISFIDFNEFMVFEDAVIQTMVFVLEKMKKIPKSYPVKYHKVTKKDITKEQIRNCLVNEKTIDGIENCLVKFPRPNLISGSITFGCSKVSSVLVKIYENSNRKLTTDEIGNGIDVLQDFVSKDHLKKLKDSKISKGDGIFVLDKNEKTKIKFNKRELEKVKPFYTPEELNKYFRNTTNEYWIIYADEEVRTDIEKYPNIKKHLDKFKPVLTSVWKPYGLHRPREQKFFEGENIFCVRKTKKPSFTYTDFSCYVARSFLILKPMKINFKFLIGLLNSKLSYFVFYFDGKKQGEQLQIDKEPLLNFPIKLPTTKQEEKISENIVQFVDLINKTRIEMDKIRLDRERQILLQKIQSLENQIDENIFQLYGLTKVDIDIINSSL